MASEPLRFSVIVASWDRLHWLRRCLRAIASLDYPAFEVIVVADGASLAGIRMEGIKSVTADEPHLSKARNAGIALAAGEICAFIDDDSVPEPLWLRRLDEAFRATGADGAVGYVRGRNGISFQSRAASVDAEAETHQEQFDGDAPCVPMLAPGRALKLVGTNMAVQREALLTVGGFDPMLRFYLDDADLSLRLHRAGYRLASAPLAEVHHAFAPSARRTALRAPTDLWDIGRSTAIFTRRHLGRADPEILERIRARERARLLRHMVRGTCEPRDVRRRLDGLEAGWRDGSAGELHGMSLTVTDPEDFLPMPQVPGGHDVIASRLLFRRRAAIRRAEDVAGTGRRVSLFSFSLTLVRHHVRYTPSGVWLQSGGIFGRSDRSGAVFRWCSFADAVAKEIRRVAKSRGIGDKQSL